MMPPPMSSARPRQAAVIDKYPGLHLSFATINRDTRRLAQRVCIASGLVQRWERRDLTGRQQAEIHDRPHRLGLRHGGSRRDMHGFWKRSAAAMAHTVMARLVVRTICSRTRA